MGDKNQGLPKPTPWPKDLPDPEVMLAPSIMRSWGGAQPPLC